MASGSSKFSLVERDGQVGLIGGVEITEDQFPALWQRLRTDDGDAYRKALVELMEDMAERVVQQFERELSNPG